MKKRVAGKVKYVGGMEPKPCCPISDEILNESKKEKENDERTEKKVKHIK